MNVREPNSSRHRDPAARSAETARSGPEAAVLAGQPPRTWIVAARYASPDDAAAAPPAFPQRPGPADGAPSGPAKKLPKIVHGRHPRGYRRPDGLILADIRALLRERPDIEATDVRASVMRGVVRLSGKVRDERQKRRVCECVANVTGVVRIASELAVGK